MRHLDGFHGYVDPDVVVDSDAFDHRFQSRLSVWVGMDLWLHTTIGCGVVSSMDMAFLKV